MKKLKIIIIAIYAVLLVSSVYGQDYEKYKSTKSALYYTHQLNSSDSSLAQNVYILGEAGNSPASRTLTSKDTVIQVSTTPFQLSDSLGSFNIYYLEMVNMAGSGTIYYGLTDDVETQGFPLLYFQSYSDEISFFQSTDALWLVASTSGCELRIRYKR